MNNQPQFTLLAVRSAAGMPTRPDVTLGEIFKSVNRRRRIILYSVAAWVLVAIVVCLVMKPRYVATEQIQVEKEGSGPLGLQSAIGQDAAPIDSVDYNTTLETEASVLMSDALAVKVIEHLNLENTYNYRPTFNPIGLVTKFLDPKEPSDPAGVPLSEAPKRRYHAVKVFSDHLKVKVVDGTRLISVSYTDPDPKRAAAVVNDLVQSYIEYDYLIRSEATSQASSWLGDQLAGLKKAAEDSQAKVARLQQSAQVYSTGDTDMNGHVLSVSVVLSRLQDLSTALSAAQSNRILKQAVYYSVRDAGADALSGLSGNTVATGASQEVMNSMSVLQGLRAQQATVKAAYASDAAKFGEDYPAMEQLKSQLADINQSIDDELKRIKVRAQSDYEIALQTEQNTQAMYNAQKSEADALNSKAIEYTVAKQEAEQNRSLYEDLYRRLKEAGALQGLRSSNISIVDPGQIPGKAKYPNVPLFLGLAVLLGLFSGSALAFYIDKLDKSILEIDQVEREIGVRPIGVLPEVTRGAREFSSRSNKRIASGNASSGRTLNLNRPNAPKTSIYPLHNPLSAYTEALRMLRVSFSQAAGDASPQVLLVTSCQPGDGKTSLSINLAATLVQQGYKVLVVECNMRRPSIQHMIGVSSGGGLREMLTSSSSPDAVSPIPNLPGGFVLTAGTIAGYPTELLGSEAMKSLVSKWRDKYDYIILDAPPALNISDPLLLMDVSDFVFMMVRYGHTTRPAMRNTYRLLRAAAKQKPVGVVVNSVPDSSGAINDYYGYTVEPYLSI